MTPVLVDLLRESGLAALAVGRPQEIHRPRLAALTDESLFGPGELRDRDVAAACRAGLWLTFDFFKESHQISQDLNTPEGSYWHGILHRREPDPANAAYWFRRVGDHPIFKALAKDAQSLGLKLGSGVWNPFDFIDLCEKHRGTDTPVEMMLRRVQRKEWELLFDWCFAHATGAG